MLSQLLSNCPAYAGQTGHKTSDIFLCKIKYQRRVKMPNFTMPKKNSTAHFSTLKASHVCIRIPDYEQSKNWFLEKLDFRLVANWKMHRGK